MRRSKRTGIAVLAASLSLALGACFEQPEIVLHEPGEYKGPRDPLLQVAGTEASNQALAERLRSIQTDR